MVSMDPKVGDFVKGDVLIEGKKITAVSAELKAPAQAQVIDAANTIIIPGFVDAHRHSWEGQLRRIIPNGAIAAYMAATHQGFARYYRPHDMYVGNLITALGCIDAGITCIIDNSHNSRSSAHSDAAIQALFDSGIRAVHASGAPQTGEWDRQWPQDLARMQKRFFTSDDQLVTLRMFAGLNRENWALARKLGLRITSETNGVGMLEQFSNEKLLGAGQHLQPLQRLDRRHLAPRPRLRRHGQCVPKVRPAVRVVGRDTGIPEGARSRNSAGVQHR